MNETMTLILQIAIVLFIANILRAVSIRLKIPPVISLIILGLALGPSLLNYLELSATVEWIAQIGILFLIFEAGIQTNLKKMREESKKAVLPALGGVILPFIAGFFLSNFFNYSFISSIFVGIIFAATSISISVITLIDIDKLKSIEGRCIVNSAIIDDILSILLISIVFGLAVETGSADTSLFSNTIFISIVKILSFFLIAFLVGLYLIPTLFHNSKRLYLENSIISISVAIIFIYSWFAEQSGLAAITGAFLAGVFIGQTEYQHEVNSEIAQVGKSFFVDFFFISIGLSLNLSVLSIPVFYLVLFIILAILSKAIGGYLGARFAKFDSTRSFRIGIGMIPRGEVALIIASMALHRNIIDLDILSTTVIMVLVTSVISPFLIKHSFSKLKKDTF